MEETILEQDFKEGTILHDSYGYDMTINVYCKIISVSKTGKTVICRMLQVNVENDNGMGAGRALPSPSDEFGGLFKLYVRNYNGKLYFDGKAPFYSSHRKGSFRLWNGKPNYHNTWD